MANNREKGALGEEIAEKYLIEKGFKILEKNWHYGKFGEVDIIAEEKNTLVFIEVKTRTTLSFGAPSEAVTEKKMNQIRMTSTAYLNQIEKRYNSVRIDVISVLLKPELKIEHLKNIC